MKICPYCRSQNPDTYQVCGRCRRPSPYEEQRKRYSTMLLPAKDKLDFVPAGARPADGHIHTPAPGPSAPTVAQVAQLAFKPAGPPSQAATRMAAPQKPGAPVLPSMPSELPKTLAECSALAQQYYNAGLYDRADAVFKRCLELDASDINIWMMRGVALRCLRKVDEALACFDKAIELKPDCVEAWRRKGFTLRILNHTEEAIVCYDKLVELNPKDTAALNDKANALDDLKRHEEAVKCYEAVLKINPKDRYAIENKEATERLLKKKAAEDYRSQFFGPKPI
jgi:tetratricopeptide (TPR) repeat protein